MRSAREDPAGRSAPFLCRWPSGISIPLAHGPRSPQKGSGGSAGNANEVGIASQSPPLRLHPVAARELRLDPTAPIECGTAQSLPSPRLDTQEQAIPLDPSRAMDQNVHPDELEAQEARPRTVRDLPASKGIGAAVMCRRLVLHPGSRILACVSHRRPVFLGRQRGRRPQDLLRRFPEPSL